MRFSYFLFNMLFTGFFPQFLYHIIYNGLINSLSEQFSSNPAIYFTYLQCIIYIEGIIISLIFILFSDWKIEISSRRWDTLYEYT